MQSTHPILESLDPMALGDFAPTDVVIHVNPPAFFAALRAFRRDHLKKPRIVGYWAWELERAPPSWAKAAAYCDEIWTPSEFVADAVKRSIAGFEGQIRVVPHPSNIDVAPKTAPKERASARAHFNIGSKDFVVGYAFSMASNFARKNPQGAIAAFQSAFPDDHNCRLLLRCPDAAMYRDGAERLRDAAKSDARIQLIEQPAVITTFYAALDCYLSMHRSEGYGLTLLEASQSGLPVIATGWGLAGEIADRDGVEAVGHSLAPIEDPQGTYDFGSDLLWAEPDIDEAARLLRKIRAALA